MQPPITISAVIPAYNSAKFIRAAISSIQAQTHPVDEIIVVDDGSTDDTENVVAQISDSIVYCKQANQGPSAARNRGIALAKGDWIAFLDADDQWTPDKIAKQLAILELHPELKLISGDMAEIDNDDRLITASVLAKHNFLESFQQLAGRPIPNALAVLVKKNFIPTGTVLVKRDTILVAGSFSTAIRFGEDLEMWAKIATNHPISCLPEVLMLRRQHGSNATQESERMLIDLTKVMASLRTYAKEQLTNQGIAPSALVSDAYWMLGYWYFSRGKNDQALIAFAASLKEHFRLNTLAHLTCCCLPQPIIQRMRTIKQKIT